MAKKVLKKAQEGLNVAVKKAAPMYKKAKQKEAEAAKGRKYLDYLNSQDRGGMGAADTYVRKPSMEAADAKRSADSTIVKGLTPSMKKGGMIKRADGSVSKRGLWDNIRANKGSGKKPTAQMLKQEKKIKATSKKK